MKLSFLRNVFLLPIFKRRESVGPIGGTYPVLHFPTAGLGIFYQLGVTRYLRENYIFPGDIQYSGISAGSYCALLCSIKANVKDIDKVAYTFIDRTVELDDSDFWSGIQGNIRETLEETGLSHKVPKGLHIAVTQVVPKPKRLYISQFNDTISAIEACIASSHVPFLFGSLATKYEETYVCDGGFAGKYDTPVDFNKIVDIESDMFSENLKSGQAFMWNPEICALLYQKGYSDSRRNADFFDQSLGLWGIRPKNTPTRTLRKLNLIS